ncbi:MAG: pilus assembly protein N-terminal domain-containing protein, partial [Planctomycetaceae bacterium]|nr:pilus assembly protein N-terminal domain-containing protein [Planctomycetaceae bacterium]
MSTRFRSHGASTAPTLRRLVGAARSVRFASVVLLVVGGLVPCADAQTPREPLNSSGFQPQLPRVPAKLPPLSQRYQEASSFIDSLSKNDATFEVVLGQGRLIVLKENLVLNDAKKKKGQPLIAVGNPDILEFEVLGPRQIRLIGKQIGVTDLVVMTESQQAYSYEVHVVYDLNLVQARIRELLPDAQVRVAQMGKNLVVEGQARDATQIRQITELVRRGILTDRVSGAAGTGAAGQPGADTAATSSVTAPEPTGGAESSGPEIINLLRVPGPQQVMLKVQVAELNRTAMRQIGSDFLYADGNGRILGSRLNNASSTVTTTGTGAGLAGIAATAAGAATPATAFAIFEGAGFQMFLSALRKNSMLKILAEPNLVAMNGHEARFLAGGEFPVPVPQSGAGGGAATITIQYKKFGVQLAFVPYILDGDTIRLSVDPEVSSIDNELGIEVSGTKVPALSTRNAHTVVELQ